MKQIYSAAPVFLSLGSNYTLQFALQAIAQLIKPTSGALESAGRELEKLVGGKVVMYYKGRDAIEQAVRAIQRKHTQQLTVFTQAAACYAIEEGITRAGAQVAYVDVGKLRLNMTPTTLEAAYVRAGKPRHGVVLVQHLLGFSAAIGGIRKWCTEHEYVLIEDLAQSFGAFDASGAVVGSFADVVVGSFGRDKILDTVSGGFAIVRNEAVAPAPKRAKSLVTTKQLIKDLLYPMTTWKVRTMHRFGIGSVIFWMGKFLGLLSSPIPSAFAESSDLPNEFGALLKLQLAGLASQLAHRRQVALMYQSQLQPWMGALKLSEQSMRAGACLRFPLLVPEVAVFIDFMKQHKVHLSDRWYRSAVDMGSYKFPTVYEVGSCPSAEFLTSHLCNLPTSQNLSVQRAAEVAELVRTFMLRPEVTQWYASELGLEVST